MKKKFLLLMLMTIVGSNSLVAPIHAMPKEDVGYAAFGGIALGVLLGWLGTSIVLTNKHEKELLEKEVNHQKAINKFSEDIKSLNERLNEQKDKEETLQRFLGVTERTA